MASRFGALVGHWQAALQPPVDVALKELAR